MAGGGGAAPEESGPKKNVFGENLPQGVELNLTALMDILSNLLFFLLASFGATVVMGINATVPVQSADKSDVADTKQTVTVNVKLTKTQLEVSAVGTAQTEEELAPLRAVIPSKDGKPDYPVLVEKLVVIKEKYPKSDTLIMTPEAGISYEVLIDTMDAARQTRVALKSGSQRIKLFPSVVVSTVVK